MKFLRTVVILALFLCAVESSGCGGEKNPNVAAVPINTTFEDADSPKTNVEELGLLVNVPYETEDTVWKETADRNQIIAVLRFSREDANRIVADIAHQAPQNVKLSSENWFPAELIAQSEMSGDESLNGLAYPAAIFYQEPYTSGRIVRIEGTDYFVLELSAK